MAKSPGTGHQWVVAATVSIPERLAATAHRRGTVRVAEETKIDVLDTYCERCRRPYEDVSTQPCPAARRKAADKEHLIGGPNERRRQEVGE